MPMSVDKLARRIEQELDKAFPKIERDIEHEEREKAAKAIAKAVVSAIKEDAHVTGMCPPGTGGGPLQLGRVR